MPKLNRAELDHLERRELQLTILAAVFVFVLAAGLAAFMYPLVFDHPDGNKWTLRVAFFGFCGLTLLFIGYLVDRQGMVRKLKQQLLEELERNVEMRHQASVDLLQSMPDINHFWDRLTMEFRRAAATEKTLSLLLVKAKAGQGAEKASGRFRGVGRHRQGFVAKTAAHGFDLPSDHGFICAGAAGDRSGQCPACGVAPGRRAASGARKVWQLLRNQLLQLSGAGAERARTGRYRAVAAAGATRMGYSGSAGV